MTCAVSTRVSLQAWSRPCRMCGQLLLILPDTAPPIVTTEIGTLCYECYPDFVQSKLATARLWDAQYTVLMTAAIAGLPKATQHRIASILANPPKG